MKLSHITKVYHNKNNVITALNNLSLEIKTTGITAIVGSSGCGKTTLLHIMSGQDNEFIGERIVDGHIEVIEQEIMLFESMSVIDNLKIVSNDNKYIHDLLEHFQMLEHQSKKVKKLSIGQKKRVQMIRSLLNNPNYLLCDEPTAALDHENAEQVMELLKELSQKMCVIIVTHDLALVDHYADVVIKMGKGIVESTKIHKNNDLLIPCHYQFEKKSLLQHIKLFYKISLSRFTELLFMFILIFVLCLSLMSSSLFNSLGHSVHVKEKWRTGENIITPQPNDGNDVYKPIDSHDKPLLESGNVYYYYDLYNNDDIQLVKDNIPEVIGYKCGWNLDIYSQFGSWLNPLTYSQGEFLLQQIESEVKSTGRKYTEFESLLKGLLEGLTEQEKEELANNYLTNNFQNLEKINNQTIVYNENLYLKFDELNENINIYQIFNHSQLPVQYGQWMKDDHEIVISKKTAEEILKMKYLSQYNSELSSIEDLIGKEFPIYLHSRSEPGIPSSPKVVSTFKVVGITYYSNETENQLFLREGVWDQLRSDFYDFQNDVNYQYVDFIVDENADSQKIANKVDELLESKESHFVTKDQSEIVKEDYQNSYVFMIFIVCLCLGMIVILILNHILIRKRENKEKALMKIYGYNSYIISLTRVILLFIIVGILQIAFLPDICGQLNSFASSLGYAYMIDHDVKRYVITWCLSLIIVSSIEIFFQKRK